MTDTGGRGAARGAADGKVNAWEAPREMSKWKGEHIVITVVTGWAVVIFGASKAFGGKKKEETKA